MTRIVKEFFNRDEGDGKDIVFFDPLHLLDPCKNIFSVEFSSSHAVRKKRAERPQLYYESSEAEPVVRCRNEFERLKHATVQTKTNDTNQIHFSCMHAV